MGFPEGSIILDSPTGTYYSGQFVNGRAVFELTKVKKVRGIYLKVKGFCKVHWTSEHSRRENDRTVYYTKNHDSYEEYINLKMYLFGSSNSEHIMNPGKYEYPINFQLPPTCPSSFEGTHAHIRYELRVVADRPFKPDQEIGHAVRVVAPLDLNTLDCKDSVEFDFDQTYCCWCMNSGSSETLVKVPVTGYCAGQVIPLEVSCRNTSTVEIEHIRFTIKKNITFRAVNESGEKFEEETLLEVRKGPVVGHTDRNWTVELPVPEVDYPNMQNCSFIDITYTLKVSVEPEGCHSDSDDSCALHFGTIPLRGAGDPAPAPAPLPHTTLAYPPSNGYQPVVTQPVLAQPQAYPGVMGGLPGNPPYPGAGPFSTSPYPGNPPYPGFTAPPTSTSPYPTPPYPTTNSPYPPSNSPYPPSSQPAVSPYPASPYPPTSSGPVVTTSPYPQTTPGVTSPYPPTTGVTSPYPPTTGVTSPYPPTSSGPAVTTSPYPQTTPGATSPYPPTSSGPAVTTSPYPQTDATSPYPPTSPGPVVTTSPYPAGSPVTTASLVKSGSPYGSQTMPMPALPPGAVPYPINHPSPYAAASAPEPSTPDTDSKLPPPTNSSPYNPDFIKN